MWQPWAELIFSFSPDLIPIISNHGSSSSSSNAGAFTGGLLYCRQGLIHLDALPHWKHRVLPCKPWDYRWRSEAQEHARRSEGRWWRTLECRPFPFTLTAQRTGTLTDLLGGTTGCGRKDVLTYKWFLGPLLKSFEAPEEAAFSITIASGSCLWNQPTLEPWGGRGGARISGSTISMAYVLTSPHYCERK